LHPFESPLFIEFSFEIVFCKWDVLCLVHFRNNVSFFPLKLLVYVFTLLSFIKLLKKPTINLTNQQIATEFSQFQMYFPTVTHARWPSASTSRWLFGLVIMSMCMARPLCLTDWNGKWWKERRRSLNQTSRRALMVLSTGWSMNN
jgi:hypothetical protein